MLDFALQFKALDDFMDVGAEALQVFLEISQQDLAIVGGGVVGLLTAAELLRAGCQVSIFDAAVERPPASWAGGGILSPLYPWRYPAPVTALVQGADRAYQSLAQRFQADGYGDIGFLRCGMQVRDEPLPDKAIAWAKNAGWPLEVKDTGIWLPSVATLNNASLLGALRAWLRDQGVRFINERVSSVASSPPLAALVVDRQQVSFDRILVAAGAWSGGVLSSLGIQLPLHPVKGQMLRYEGVPRPSSVILEARGYLIPRSDGAVLVGSTVEPGESDQRPTRQGYLALTRLAADLLPALAGRSPVAHWAGLRPGTDRALPWLGELPEQPNIFLATGHYRNGLVCAPASARIMAALIQGTPPELDISPYAISGLAV